jgi:DNA polymerase I-like protein with 3'-5' exonuclease and polymerase domains
MIMQVREDCLTAICEVVRQRMQGCVSLLVPLQVRVKVGPSWGQLKPYGDESPVCGPRPAAR